MTLEDAIETEASLRAKIDAAKARAPALDARRAAISFDAHTHGGKAKELDALNKERATLAIEVENIEFALAEAGRRVAAARRDVEIEAKRENARRVLEIAAIAESRGGKIAEAARTLRDEIRRMAAELAQIRQLGAPIVQERLFVLAMTRAISPLLREAGLDMELVPPNLRHDPSELAAGYVKGALSWADKLLASEAA